MKIETLPVELPEVGKIIPLLPAASSETVARVVFGRLETSGFIISETQFWSDAVRSWEPTVQPDSLVFCLNTAGYGSLQVSGAALDFTSNTGGYFFGNRAQGHRARDETHRFITVEVGASLWSNRLGTHLPALRADFSQLLLGKRPNKPLAGLLPKDVAVDKLARQMVRPPVVEPAWPLWLECKIGELLSQIAFAPNEENFCTRYQRVSRERVDQVVQILRTRLNEPPSLGELGRLVGSSPFHLSRIFSAETGRTIPQFLRQLRMERAAELLQSGEYNVTETAFQIGYSSLSHFSKSYFQTFGVLPKNGARMAG